MGVRVLNLSYILEQDSYHFIRLEPCFLPAVYCALCYSYSLQVNPDEFAKDEATG